MQKVCFSLTSSGRDMTHILEMLICVKHILDWLPDAKGTLAPLWLTSGSTNQDGDGQNVKFPVLSVTLKENVRIRSVRVGLRCLLGETGL